MPLQGGEQFPVVHCELVHRPEAVPDALRQKRFDISGRCRQRDGVSLLRQPIPNRPKIVRISTIDRNHERLAGSHHIRGQPVGETVVPQPQRLQADLQQTFLARPALAVRSTHSAAHPGRTVLHCSMDANRQTALRRTPGHRQSDHPAADDGQIRHGGFTSLPPPV